MATYLAQLASRDSETLSEISGDRARHAGIGGQLATRSFACLHLRLLEKPPGIQNPGVKAGVSTGELKTLVSGDRRRQFAVQPAVHSQNIVRVGLPFHPRPRTGRNRPSHPRWLPLRISSIPSFSRILSNKRIKTEENLSEENQKRRAMRNILKVGSKRLNTGRNNRSLPCHAAGRHPWLFAREQRNLECGN